MRYLSLAPVLRALLMACAFASCAPCSSLALAQNAPVAPAQFNRVPDQIPGQVAGTTRAASVRLAGHIPGWANLRSDRGAVPDATRVQLTVGLSRSPALEAAFTSLLTAQTNPGSPSYHHWLSPDEIGAQYGPTEHDLNAVAAWLAGAGFQIDSVSPTRTSIRVTAPAGVVAQALQTQLHLYSAGSRTLRAPSTEPAVPAALAPVIRYISGLSDVPYTTYSQRRSVPMPGAGSGSTGIAHPDYSAQDGSHYLFPDDFNTIYDITPLLSSGNNGSGQKIAILGGSQLAPSDLTTWESLSNLAAAQPNYITPPTLTQPTQTNDGDQDEGTLDFERAHGTAPGAQIDMIVAQNWLNLTTTDTMITYELNTLRDPVLSLSFGVCEVFVAPSYIQNEDALFQQAAAEGISVFVSAGDSGAAGCESHGVAPPPTQQFVSANAICASSHVTCVGGTEFADTVNPTAFWSSTNGSGLGSALGYIPEGAFNEPLDPNGAAQIFGGGGGASTVIPKPSWQRGPGVPNDLARDTPDVSFSSSGHDGYFSCLGYAQANCQGNQGGVLFSGTSAAAPSMAGIAALVDQKAGSAQGNLNPHLYRIAVDVPVDFHDATQSSSGVAICDPGTPSMCNNSTPGSNGALGLAGYPLTPGYDLATGLGSLDVAAFAHTAALPASTVSLAATPSTITISQTATLTATIPAPGGAAPDGTVQFYSNGNALGAPVALASGVATLPGQVFKPAATYVLTATYNGGANFIGSDSAPINLVVTNPNAVPSTTALSVSAGSVTSVQTVNLTAAVTGSKGAATGSIQFLADGQPFLAPIPLSAGSATFSSVLLPSGSHSITAFYVGDDNYSASTSNAVPINVTPVNALLANSVAPGTITPLGSAIVAITLTPGVPNGPTPTGSVTLVGVQPSITLPLTNGIASLQLSGNGTALPVGSYPFYWVYSGDSVYATSTSATANLVVTAAAGIGVAAATPNVTVKAGTAASDGITLTSNGFSGTQTLSCSVAYSGTGTATLAPTCALTPTAVTLAANGTAISTLSISTTAAHAVPGKGGSASNRFLRLTGWSTITLASLFLFVLPRRSRAHLRSARLLSALILLAGSLSLLSGCGGGSGSTSSGSGGGGGTVPGTTAGAYTITVNATGANNTGGTVTVALTVQ